MKFEKPIMNISKFDVENIVTGSTNLDIADGKADDIIKANPDHTVKVVVTF